MTKEDNKDLFYSVTSHTMYLYEENCCHREGYEIQISSLLNMRRDSSVGIALVYWLDDRGSGVRFSAGAGNFSLHHRIQNGSGAHPASYPMGTRVSFPGGKAAEA
jgi:hypothetical protein